MKITELRDRTDKLLTELLELWEKSVHTTHLFLNESDIQNIKKYVPKALNNVPHLIIAADSQIMRTHLYKQQITLEKYFHFSVKMTKKQKRPDFFFRTLFTLLNIGKHQTT